MSAVGEGHVLCALSEVLIPRGGGFVHNGVGRH
jgi:hypothetical protein